MLDYERVALEDTMKILMKNKIEYVGSGFDEKEAFSVKIKKVKAVKIGFLAYTNLGSELWKAGYESPGLAWINEKDLERVKEDVKKSKEKVDILIVSLHSGEEYEANPISFQTSFAATSIDAGADLVIGHHPHIIQKIEKYKEGWIFYSLGNFLFDQKFSEETMEAVLAKIVIKNKKIDKVIPLKIKLSDSFQPDFVKNYYLEDFSVKKKEELRTSEGNFLEVNLADMKVRVYREGEIKKEVSILNKGDGNFWAGTAAGIYSVISKRTNVFSSTADVYMPWAINFYGKYYIHGQPYFSNGELSNLGYTGGCVQLLNDDAKDIYDLVEEKTPVLVTNQTFGNRDLGNHFKKLELIPEVSARAYLVADLDSNFVFAEKSSRTQLPIDSLTKLMTAVVLAENIDLRESILVRQEMLGAYGSTEGLAAGKRFRVVELFYPLLMESSNDAAEVLSYFLGRGWTINLMNKKAKALGMDSANFADPSGVDAKNISTAQGLFYLAEYLLNTRLPLLKITKGEDVETFGEVNFKNLKNKNIFFDEKNFLGGKSDYVISSKYTAIFLFRVKDDKNDIEKNIAVIFLDSESPGKDAGKVLEWLKENYSLTKI